MAEKIVAVPDIGNVSFPDTMSDDDIGAAISRSRADVLAQRQAASKAAFEANQPSLLKGFASEALQNTQRLGQKLFNTEPQINAQQEEAKKSMGDLFGIPYSGKALDIAGAVWPSPGGVSLPTQAANALPSAARAGKAMQAIEQAAKNVTVDTSAATPFAERAAQMTERGFGEAPAPMKAFTRLTKPGSAQVGKDIVGIEPPPLGYQAAEDIRKAAGDILGNREITAGMTNSMKSQLSQFYGALKTSNRAAAETVGMGDMYDAAINEFRQAKTIENAANVAKKFITRAAVSGAVGTAGYGLFYELRKALGY